MIQDDFSTESVWNEFQTINPQLLQKEHIFIYDLIDSTNTESKRRISQKGFLLTDEGRLSKDGEVIHKTLIAASEQTAGHGRLGRNFYSPSKTGIYFSFIYVPENSQDDFDPSRFTVTAAVSVCRAIVKLFGESAKIKWVNDIYLNDKKICGILTEGITNKNNKVEATIIGIGINIATNENLPTDLSKKVGGIISSEKSTPKAESLRAKLLATVINELILSLDNHENVIPEYRKQSMLTNKTLTVTPLIGGDKTFEAKVLDITDDAGLLVELQNGEQKVLHSGEVTLH